MKDKYETNKKLRRIKEKSDNMPLHIDPNHLTYQIIFHPIPIHKEREQSLHKVGQGTVGMLLCLSLALRTSILLLFLNCIHQFYQHNGRLPSLTTISQLFAYFGFLPNLTLSKLLQQKYKEKQNSIILIKWHIMIVHIHGRFRYMLMHFLISESWVGHNGRYHHWGLAITSSHLISDPWSPHL